MTYAATVLADTPEAYYRLGELAGTTAFDSSGNARHAGVAGTGSFFVNPVPGLIYADPDGATASLGGAPQQTFVYQIPSGLDFLTGLAAVSVEMWVRSGGWETDVTTAGPAYVSMDATSGGSAGVAAGFPDSGDVTALFRTEEDPGTTLILTATGTGWDDGGPHHLVATADGADLTLYQDGVQVATSPYPGGTFAANVFAAEQFGTSVAIFDEVAFYDTVLSPARVAAHYLAGSAPAPVPPPPPASLDGTTGWTFEVITPAGTRHPLHPGIDATLTHDSTREIRRTCESMVLLPEEAALVDLVADRIAIALRVDGVAHPMGIYAFTDDALIEDAVTDMAGATADLTHTSLGDRFTRLRAADETPRVALAGTDPSQVIIEILAAAGLPHSIAGSAAPFAVDITWPPGTTLETIVSQCAEVAGHRRPWADNDGIIRSVAAGVIDTDVIPLADLHPTAGSVVITSTRLSAPNRVVVVDDAAPVRTTGAWDAPASAPNSAARRGWTQVLIVAQQGLSGAAHAETVAATIGEQIGARKLSATIPPTWRLDGPVILTHTGAYWMVTAWTVGLGPTAIMSFDAIEVNP